MWESSIWRPQGSVSLRRIFVLATALFVACFVYIITSAPLAHAADASWSNGSISYQNNSYGGPIEVTRNDQPPGLKSGDSYYLYIDNSSNKKAHVIYFSADAAPSTATSARYVVYEYKGSTQFSSPTNQRKISITPSSSSTPLQENSSCTVDFGIGWMVCGISKGLAWAVDKVFEFIKGFLEVRPLSTDTENGVYKTWSITRSIANVAFVIAFLILIYSQITGVGVSSYGTKKMLPRIIIAVVLVNVSYWICAVAVDVFNILGMSVQELFISIRNTAIGSETYDWDVLNWEDLVSYILSGGAAIGGSLVALKIIGAGSVGVLSGNLVLLLLPILLLFLIAVIVVFFILAARQAIIMVCIVIAPLAFVAYLLPNTEKWFEKWRDIFLTMLLVYPMFSLLFGGSQLAAAIMIQNASSVYMIILAMGIQLVPLAITPLLLKLSGGILNRFAGIINNPSKGVVDRTKNWANEKVERNKAEQMDKNRQAALAGKIKQVQRKHGKQKGQMRYSHMSARGRALNSYYGAQARKGETEAYQGSMAESFHGTEAYSKIDHIKRTTEQYKRDHEGQHDKHWYAQMDQQSGHFSRAVYDREMAARRSVGEGTEAKNLSDKAAEAHWETFALGDTNTRRVRAAAHNQSLKAQEAKEAWDDLVISLESGKANAHVKAEFGNVSVEVNENSRKLAARALEKAANTNMKSIDFAEEIQINTSLQAIAAGIDPNGGQRALANAINTVESAHEETIKNVSVMLKDYNLTDAQKVDLVLGNAANLPPNVTITDDIQEAAIREIASGGNIAEVIRMSEGMMDSQNDRHRRSLTNSLRSNSSRPKFFGFGAMGAIDQHTWQGGQAGLDEMIANTLNADKFTAESLIKNMDEDGVRRLAEAIDRGQRGQLPAGIQFDQKALARFRTQVVKMYEDDDYNGLIGERGKHLRRIARELGFENELPPDA